MSEKEVKRKGKSILLKSGENPIFVSFNKNGMSIAQRIENKSSVKIIKSNKGLYYVMDIPFESCLKLSYLALKRSVAMLLKQTKKTEKIDISELFDETKEEKSEGVEVTFD
ncbi:MAG: hypothetical protein QXH21_09710 [Ignisphaera sp.]